DHHVRRRLLEILEQGVGRVLVQQVRPEDEVDAALRLERTHVQVTPELADRVDADLVAERLQHVEVGVGATRDPTRLAEELPGERERGPSLADSGRPMEEERMGGLATPGERRREETLRRV